MLTNNDNKYIRISVYYNRLAWTELIRDCLKPFIFANRANKNIDQFFISFSTDQGDNIRLVLECTAEDKVKFVEEMHLYLINYINENPSSIPYTSYWGNSFFMDFENNSLQYNLFDIDHKNNIIELLSFISELILDTFAEEDYDDSSVLTFVLEIFMGFCLEWQKFYSKDVNNKIRQTLFGDELKKGSYELNDSYTPYYDLFKENSDLIAEIYARSSDSDEKNSKIIFLKKLYSECLINADSIKEDYTNYFPLDKIIMDQLDIKESTLLYVLYLIHLSIEENNKLIE